MGDDSTLGKGAEMTYDYALALGGGGARGVAHIGVVLALEAAGLRPRLVTGTSMGAVVGAVYAQHPEGDAGWTRLQEFLDSDLFRRTKVEFIQPAAENISLAQRARHYVQRVYLQGRVLTRPSVLPGDVVRSVVDYFIEDGYLEDTRIPFAAVAADMGTGQAVTLHQGPIREAVLASMSIPGFMPPVELNGRQLMDGGVVSLVPIEAAISLGASRVVAVDVEKELAPLKDGLSALEVIFRADEIQGNELRKLKNRAADLVLIPQVGEIHWSDFNQVERVLDAGRAAVEGNLDAIRRVVTAPSPPASAAPEPERPRPGPWAGLRRWFTGRGRSSGPKQGKECRRA
jgi:NTE family protein